MAAMVSSHDQLLCGRGNWAPPRGAWRPAGPALHAAAPRCPPHPADKAMQDVFGALYVSLHVRVGNKVAFHLYTESLGYQ